MNSSKGKGDEKNAVVTFKEDAENNDHPADRAESEVVFDLWQEASRLFYIALPMIPVQFSLYFIFPEGASVVGRELGTVELAAFSLGSLVGNLTCLSILEGALTAADTLMPRAFGAQLYREVGYLAVRGAVVSFVLLVIPIIPLCLYSAWILMSLGQDEEASRLAQEWIQIYFLGAPANLVFRLLMRFVLAQNKPWPPVFSSLIPCVIINPILLEWFVSMWGLPGSAAAISATQWCMTIFLVLHLYIKPVHHPETVPEISCNYLKEALRAGPLMEFAHMSLGGMFSLADWWLWEIMCFIAGSFGVVPLCVHTVAYNLVPLLFMIPLGLINGMTVRLGSIFVLDPARAERLAAWGFCLNSILGVIVCLLLYVFRLPIIKLFTKDDDVIQGCLDIWIFVCMDVFALYIFGMNHASYRVLGIQGRIGVLVAIILWLGLLPALFVFSMWMNGGIYVEWILIPSFYALLQVALIVGLLMVDWKKLSKKSRKRMLDEPESESEFFEALEHTPLLNHPAP